MTNTLVARRYADALFSLGTRQGKDAVDAYGARLAELSGLMELEPKLGQLLRSPVIEISEKKAVIDALLDKLSADRVLRNFCFLLADKERLGELPGIANWYGILLDNAKGILRGKVVTAIALSADRQAKLKNSLQEKSGKQMELEFEVDPEILGGLVLAIGDKVLDTSLRAQLGVLGSILKRGK